MTRRRGDGGDGSDSRARRILERLSGSSRSLDESTGSLEGSSVADRLQEIEQLFLLHGGERDVTFGPSKDEVLFEWGPLQVLEPLGAGTFGEVFRAYDRTLDRDIALKLLKGEQGRPFQSQLFLHEARQLAMVRHRHVLAVHGAAVHDGRPGLWTDLIDGVNAHDDALRDSFRELDASLELIESLALALQAVHSAGLVHGDIKPSNLMRDEGGEWILMDFGASRAAQIGGSGPSLTSGTPLYMAPEVVLGDAPDARADLYSMGATLYRVLTGKPPFEVRQWEELRALHQNGRSPNPTCLPVDASGRLGRLIDRLMATEPDQRPEIDDVLAEVRSIREAPHKRFRRIAFGSIAVVLTAGLVATSIGFFRANEARLLAEGEQKNTYAVNEFLQQVLYSPSSSGRGRDLTVEEMLREAEANVARSLEGQEEARITVHRVLAASYNALQLTDRAEAQIRLGRETIEKSGLSMPAIERKLALEEIISAFLAERRNEAIELAERFLDEYAHRLGDDHIDVRYARTYIVENHLASNRNEEAERLLDRYFTEVPEPETAPDEFGFNILRNRTMLLIQQGRFEEAMASAERAVDWLDRYPDARANDRADALATLARSLARVNQPARAVEVYRRVVDLRERIYGPGSSEHVAALNDMSGAQREAGDVVGSGETLQRALDDIGRNPNEVTDVIRLSIMSNLANVLNETGQQARGEALIRETREEVVERFGAESQQAMILEYNLSEQLSLKGRFEEALEITERTLEMKTEVYGPDHYLTLLTMDNLAVALAGLGRGEEAIELHDRARASLAAQVGSEHPFALLVERHRTATLLDFAAERIEPGAIEELVRRHEAALGSDHPDTIKARALLDG